MLWKEKQNVKKYHLVKWVDVCRPKVQGEVFKEMYLYSMYTKFCALSLLVMEGKLAFRRISGLDINLYVKVSCGFIILVIVTMSQSILFLLEVCPF
jgi:hypothetical protein